MHKQVSSSVFVSADENARREIVCYSGSKRTSSKELTSSATKRKPLANISNSGLAESQTLWHKNAGPFSLGDSIWSATVAENSQFHLCQAKTELNSSLLLSSPEFLLQEDAVTDANSLESEEKEAGCHYTLEVFEHLKQAEVTFRPSATYMSKQPDITYSMRAVLIDWLSEVCEEYRLQQATLYLCISYVDRFLSKMAVNRAKLQLLGTCCMYLASKMEEIYPPNINEFVYITDNSYTKKQVIEMEKLVLQTLNWHLICPTMNSFVTRYLSIVGADDCCEKLTWYLCELAQMNGDVFLKYLPSEMAASAVCLALYTLHKPAWPNTLEHYSGYTRDDADLCVRDLHKLHCNSPRSPQQAIREKYSTDKYLRVAHLKPRTVPPA